MLPTIGCLFPEDYYFVMSLYCITSGDKSCGESESTIQKIFRKGSQYSTQILNTFSMRILLFTHDKIQPAKEYFG